VRVSRRNRRVLAGLAAAVATLIAWDQTGLLPGSLRGTEVAGASFTRAEAGGRDWDGLSRLRLDPGSVLAAAADTAAPAGPPPAGDTAIAPPPETFEAPAPAPPPPPALRRTHFDGVTPEGGTWAVMIGINDYPGTSHDLRSAVNDATDVNEALTKMGVAGDHRLLIRDGQATASTIRASVDWLNAHAGPDAIAVFFYAGHVRKIDSNTEAIVAADGGTVPDTQLAELLDGLQARRAWIALAACYSGGFTEVLRPGRILTAASPANSVAYENEGFGRSYLVQYMVRKAMIEGAAPTSVEAAFAWAKEQLSREYPDRVPVQYDSDPSELDLRQAKARSASSGSSPPSSNPPTTTTTAPPANGAQPPPDPTDGCANLTIGIIRCKG
jgi:cell division septation protein DedD